MQNGLIEIRLIDLGGDVGEVRLIEWHVTVGERIERGDLIYTVESEKVAIEVESEHGGVVEERLAAEGDVVRQDQPLLTLRA